MNVEKSIYKTQLSHLPPRRATLLITVEVLGGVSLHKTSRTLILYPLLLYPDDPRITW